VKALQGTAKDSSGRMLKEFLTLSPKKCGYTTSNALFQLSPKRFDRELKN